MTDIMTPNEKEVWSHLAKAYGAFCKLEQTHPSHQKDFVDGIHVCQHIIGQRILQRLAPQHFATYKNTFGVWSLEEKEDEGD